jgi:mono/diheme cytochrome c family protein
MQRRFTFLAMSGLLAVLACGKERPAPASDSAAAASPTASATPTYTYTDPRGAIFAEKGCPQCHTISGLGIKSPAEIGPDLTLADEDVVNRFSMPLETFLHNPTGTMQVVLSSQIQLSTAERDSIIRILKAINHERHEAEEKKDD